jgi:ribosomal protein S11
MRLYYFIICMLFVAPYAQGQYIIRTFAGTATSGYSGDGGAATAAAMGLPYGVAVDTAGNVYSAEYNNYIIRKVSVSGIITTYAGTGSTGYSGDGGPATAARMASPSCVAADRAGNVYFGELNGDRIRKVNPSGIISTYAGTGSPGFSGDSSAATSAQLDAPNGIAVDSSGNLYIADIHNARIRMVTPAGIIYTIAGTGTVGYSGDGGPATAAQLRQPTGVAADNRGNIFVSDGSDYRIRKINSSGIISTVAGTGSSGFSGDGGPATAATLFYPYSLSTDTSGNIYIADQGNNRIRKIDGSGIITTIAGVSLAGFGGDNGPGVSAHLNLPAGVACGRLGKVYIADKGNSRLRVLDTCAAPFFGPIAGDSVMCMGAASALSDTLSGGTWYSDHTSVVSISPTSGTIRAISAGTAHITYTFSNTCAVLVAYHTIIVNPLPTAGIIIGKDTLCPGDTATFSVTLAGGAGAWRSANTSVATVSSTGLVTGVASGVGLIRYIYTNSCGSDSASFPFVVPSNAICNASADGYFPTVERKMAVSPNPNHGSFAIFMPALGQTETAVSVINVLGKKVQVFPVKTGVATDVRLNLPAGVYMLSCFVGGQQFLERVIIE